MHVPRTLCEHCCWPSVALHQSPQGKVKQLPGRGSYQKVGRMCLRKLTTAGGRLQVLWLAFCETTLTSASAHVRAQWCSCCSGCYARKKIERSLRRLLLRRSALSVLELRHQLNAAMRCCAPRQDLELWRPCWRHRVLRLSNPSILITYSPDSQSLRLVRKVSSVSSSSSVWPMGFGKVLNSRQRCASRTSACSWAPRPPRHSRPSS
mmetsp:Transcript_21964/g.54940  ORF Transcript_21964/g.54940 Transcript_21964/m.54940 type:complete len:207 (+) Transcript_21964:523-1143(+)